MMAFPSSSFVAVVGRLFESHAQMRTEDPVRNTCPKVTEDERSQVIEVLRSIIVSEELQQEHALEVVRLADEHQVTSRDSGCLDKLRMRQIARDGLEIADDKELGELAISLGVADALGNIVYEAYGDSLLHRSWHKALAEEERRIEESS